MNNESHKGKILRTNESQINYVTRGSDEGQWGNPGGRASAANKMNQTGNYAQVRPRIHVMMKFVVCKICMKKTPFPLTGQSAANTSSRFALTWDCGHSPPR